MRPGGARGLALAGCLVLAGCRAAAPEPSPFPDRRATGPDALMYGVKAAQAVNGRVEWEIVAQKAWHSRQAERLHGRGVRVYYYPEGRNTATLYATAVRYDVEERRLLARGDVRVESETAVLETSELEFDSRRGKVYSDKAVKITRGENVMTGTGLEADPDLRNMRILDPHVTARDPADLKPLVEALDK